MGARTEAGTIAPSERALRGRLVRYLVLLVAATTGAIVAVLLWTSVEEVETLSHNLIRNAAKQTQASLSSFFEPVCEQIRIDRRRCDELGVRPNDPDGMSSLFVPLLRTSEQVSSLMFADARGQETMLLWTGTEWKERVTYGDADEQGRTGWRVTRRTPERALIDVENSQDLDYDPHSRQWYQQVATGPLEQLRWTEPYTFFTTGDPGITASIAFDRNGTRHVLAYDVMLRDISQFTTGMEVATHGMAVVLDEHDRVLGLPRRPRYADAASMTADVLQPVSELELPELQDALDAWRADERAGDVVSYESNGETWWTHVEEMRLDDSRALTVAVLVPESDFRASVDYRRNLILSIAAAGLIGAFVLALLLNRAVRAQMARAVADAQQLGQYTLLGKIGEGGMGAVYHAQHSMLRRPCAIKMIRSENTENSTSLTRFEREVQATAELVHPNTISIYDYGSTPDGVFYYAMEYLRGVSLGALVRETGPQPPGRVIHILRQVCGSLTEAHERGLVHRDIKPGNVMLCDRGGIRDVVKVLDFGLVKDTDSKEATVTQAGMLFGTPSYMSPEGVRDPTLIAAPSDLYAVGAIGYYLLSGTTPIRGETMMEVITNHLTVKPDRPAERLGKPLPDDLQDIILCCLAKKPEDRPSSARELELLLAACVDAGSWSDRDAAAWWSAHEDLVVPLEDLPDGSAGALDVDLRSRRRR